LIRHIRRRRVTELIAKEAYTLAAGLIEKDLGFKEAPSTPNYEWMIEIGGLPIGWTVDEPADLSIYNWDTGAPVYRHARMEETARTATSIRYSWKWDMKNVLCGRYVGSLISKRLHSFILGSPSEIALEFSWSARAIMCPRISKPFRGISSSPFLSLPTIASLSIDPDFEYAI
jgi:hypothetical protein